MDETSNVSEDPRAQYSKEAQEEGIAGIVWLLLPIKGRFIGVVRLYAPKPLVFSVEEINSAEVLAETGGIARENVGR